MWEFDCFDIGCETVDEQEGTALSVGRDARTVITVALCDARRRVPVTHAARCKNERG